MFNSNVPADSFGFLVLLDGFDLLMVAIFMVFDLWWFCVCRTVVVICGVLFIDVLYFDTDCFYCMFTCYCGLMVCEYACGFVCVVYGWLLTLIRVCYTMLIFRFPPLMF